MKWSEAAKILGSSVTGGGGALLMQTPHEWRTCVACVAMGLVLLVVSIILEEKA